MSTTESALEAMSERLAAMERRLASLPDPDQLTMVVFSGDLDRLLAAFNIATTAAAMGKRVTMFFTFWSTPALRRRDVKGRGKSVVETAFGWMLPRGLDRTKLSKLEMMGMGRWLMTREMQRKNVSGLGDMLSVAAALGVCIAICEMSMSLMGIQEEELIEYPTREICGAATFIERASSSATTLFI